MNTEVFGHLVNISRIKLKFYLYLLLVLHVTVTNISCDPCTSYTNFDSENDFVRSAANGEGSLCDNFLTAGWYRVTNKAGDRMPTECIYGGFRCGTTYSIWMNGTYPLSGQLKNVTACAASYNGNCCAYTHNIQVKNCSDFLVYYLVPVSSCSQAYCFGSELPCPTGQTSKNGFTPGCEPDPCNSSNYNILVGGMKRSSNYTLRPDDTAIDDLRLKTGWYRIDSAAGNDIVNFSVRMLQCGTAYPLWMKGSIPESSSYIEDRTVCRSGLFSFCESEYNIKVRNCGDYRTYYLPQLITAHSAYCFGSLLIYEATSTKPTTNSAKTVFSTTQSQQQSASTTTSSEKTVFSTTQSQQQSASTTSTLLLTLGSELTETSTSKIPITDLLLPVTYEDNDKLVVIITSVVASISTTCILVIFIVWISRRKSSKNKDSDTEKRDQSSYPPTYEKAVHKDTSPHVYDDIGKYETIQKEETVYDEIPEGTQKTAIKPKVTNIYI